MPATSLYFLDIFVSNEGDSNTALEIGVLRYDGEHRPQVYLHYFLKPITPNRVRWSIAKQQEITRDLIVKHPNLPTLRDIIACGFLKGKTVVCLNPSLEPCKAMVRESRTHSLISLWQEVFLHNEEALRIQKVSQMLEFLGLPYEDDSGSGYTQLLCRLQAMIAIWDFLESRRDPHLLRQEIFEIPESKVWPIPKLTNLLLKRNVDDFSKIDKEEIIGFFSESLPDFLNWNEISIFSRDWVFKRKSCANISILNGKMPMCEYIFNRVLEFKLQLWVLIYYSLYDHKTDYARIIALNHQNFAKLAPSVREDFAQFLISHLEDFLSREQKCNIIRAMVRQTLASQAQEPCEDYDFEALKINDHGNRQFKVSSPEGTSLKVFSEIRSRNDDVLYLQYEILGRNEEREICAEFINYKFRELLYEVQNPFSQVWLPRQLQTWIQYITGFSFAEIKRTTSTTDPEPLTNARLFLKGLLEEETLAYRQRLRNDLANVVEKINKNLNPKEDFICAFAFQGITIRVISRKDKASFLERLLNF